MKISRRSIFSVFAAGFGLGLTATLTAKKKKEPPTRSVKGEVTDESEDPLRGVVQLKNTRTLDVKSFHLDPRGKYYFHGLDPNVDYQIKAMAQGYKSRTRTISTFDNRMELNYNFRLKKQ